MRLLLDIEIDKSDRLFCRHYAKSVLALSDIVSLETMYYTLFSQ
jgi:hypothetical protein